MCADHAKYVAGCGPCKAANKAYRDSRPKPPPHDPIYTVPLRQTPADDAYTAGLMELLLQREMTVARASDLCSELLDEWANRRP